MPAMNLAATLVAVLALLPAAEPPAGAPVRRQPLRAGEVRLTIVYDNVGDRPGLTADWGYACVVESRSRRVLFDTGRQPETLLANLQALGYDPLQIDAVVISHAHGDHTGGLPALLRLNPSLQLFVPAGSGLAAKLQETNAGSVVEVSAPLEVAPGVVASRPLTANGLPEVALAVATPRGLAVLLGCAHPGVGPMVAGAVAAAGEQGIDRAGVLVVLGGFHLISSPAGELELVVANLRHLGVERVAPSHCTGEAATAVLARAWGLGFLRAEVGWSLTVAPAGSR